MVRRALGDALGKGPAPELTLRTTDVLPGRPMQPSIPGALHGGSFPSRWAPPPIPSATAPGFSRGTTDAGITDRGIADPPAAPSVRPMIALGQFRDTFIIAMDDEGLCIIDQHVAHERVLFERIMERLTTQSLESQRLLIPVVLELPPAERAALVSKAEALARFGFDVEEFGGDSIKVTAMPALLAQDQCDAALRALADDLEGLDRGLRLEDALKQIAATTACHAAVKAHYPLTLEKMHHILEELRATAYSTVCPHGRPVMLRITRREIEKNFDRI
jgi:DNA mismatch repair protein MutL